MDIFPDGTTFVAPKPTRIPDVSEIRPAPTSTLGGDFLTMVDDMARRLRSSNDADEVAGIEGEAIRLGAALREAQRRTMPSNHSMVTRQAAVAMYYMQYAAHTKYIQLTNVMAARSNMGGAIEDAIRTARFHAVNYAAGRMY